MCGGISLFQMVDNCFVIGGYGLKKVARGILWMEPERRYYEQFQELLAKRQECQLHIGVRKRQF